MLAIYATVYIHYSYIQYSWQYSIYDWYSTDTLPIIYTTYISQSGGTYLFNDCEDTETKTKKICRNTLRYIQKCLLYEN